MTTRQNIELRRSEIRERLGTIATLEGDARTEAITAEQSGLMVELREPAKVRLQAAIASRGKRIPGCATPETARMPSTGRSLVRCSLGDIFAATLEHRATEGAVRELQEHLGLGCQPSAAGSCSNTEP